MTTIDNVQELMQELQKIEKTVIVLSKENLMAKSGIATF